MKPIVLGMLLCDHYYRDSSSGKSIIVGTFSSINCPTFPTKHGNCALYIVLTDVQENGKVQIKFRHMDSDFSMDLPEWSVEKTEDARKVVEIGGNINGLPLPKEGYYEFVVTWNGSELFSRSLVAKKNDKYDKDKGEHRENR